VLPQGRQYVGRVHKVKYTGLPQEEHCSTKILGLVRYVLRFGGFMLTLAVTPSS
jgi:hypothetical protein